MAYVSIPNDLSKIKTKVAFNLTKRQLICFGSAAVIGIPAYLFTRAAIGGTGAMTGAFRRGNKPPVLLGEEKEL